MQVLQICSSLCYVHTVQKEDEEELQRNPRAMTTTLLSNYLIPTARNSNCLALHSFAAFHYIIVLQSGEVTTDIFATLTGKEKIDSQEEMHGCLQQYFAEQLLCEHSRWHNAEGTLIVNGYSV